MICHIEGCDRPVHVQSRGLCKLHYDRAQRAGEIPKRRQLSKTCVAPGCDREDVYAHDLCDMHYRRLRNRGSLERRTFEERFWKNVPDRPDGGYCWEWRGAKFEAGYGSFRVGDHKEQAHRVAYELSVGPIPEGLVIDHRCMNKGCVNPEHLHVVTFRENILMGNNMAARWARRTECHICGGELVFRPTTGKNGVRVCRACERRRSKEKAARQKAKRSAQNLGVPVDELE